MLTELSEADATGEIAGIYREIRHLCGVPYVSSMQRHLATRPGWLEWAWAAIGPVFRTGAAQKAAWRVAADLSIEPIAKIPRPSLRICGLTQNDEASVSNICESFIRVSPTNMVFSALLKRLLAGDVPGGGDLGSHSWTPPAPLPVLPQLINMNDLDPSTSATLTLFATDTAGQPFIPGFYRMLAQWPALIAHLAVVLPPKFTDPATTAACDDLRHRIDHETSAILAALPAPPDAPALPPKNEHSHVLNAIATYRKTSPEMVVFGRMVRDAMPT